MVYRGNEKENHRGSIVKYPKLRYPERDFGETVGFGKEASTNEVIEWVEDVLLEPVVVQIVVGLKHGMRILSRGEYPMVHIEDADLWSEECELRLKQLKLKFEKENARTHEG